MQTQQKNHAIVIHETEGMMGCMLQDEHTRNNGMFTTDVDQYVGDAENRTVLCTWEQT